METVLGTMYFTIILVCFLIILPNRTRIISSIIINIFISFLIDGILHAT